MRILLILIATVVLMACEATPVNNAAAIKTKVKLKSEVALPVQLPVAYYVDKSEFENKVNFYGKMEEAAQLVTEQMFMSGEKLSNTSAFVYLIDVKSSSSWDYVWGGWESDIEVAILDHKGNKLMSRNIKKSASGAGGLYDFNAVYNSFAEALKSFVIEFLNSETTSVLAAVREYEANGLSASDISNKAIFKDLQANNSGSGFFVNNKGTSVTAAHVVEQCIFIELNHKGETYDVELLASSKLLDLAILQVDLNNEVSVTIEEEPSVSLGKQVFVTGYPLSGILAAYPSLTVGNISSLGGLKGAKNYFQFTAPIQPGNSGGAITDYKGNLMGVVSSTLNQAMMLQNSGTTSQNVNFGVNTELLKRFLHKYDVEINEATSDQNFERSSADAVEYSTQILCYQ
ncbi:S1C family serine protease [Glaciecola sp. 2405UD65-10]|uniref:S1C family serine protease n=1 Tax=Glaciecola sp. 2405UD65-10 TaxID=3397244 RepID=UPI003B59C078